MKDGLTCCGISDSGGGSGAAATGTLTREIVLGGEGRFRGGGRPVGRAASGRIPGEFAERPKPIDVA